MRRSPALLLLPMVMAVVVTTEFGGTAATAAPMGSETARARDDARSAALSGVPSTTRAEARGTRVGDVDPSVSRSGAVTDMNVVARAGSTALESSRLSKAFGSLRDFQRKKYGTTAQLQLRGYLEQVAVRDLLLAERGQRTGLRESPRVKAQSQWILEDALIDQLRRRIERETPVTDAEVKAYYERHPELFRTPERIRILRLLVENEAEAVALIERVKTLPTMDDWRNLVREKSKDKATRERGGDLGFVAADGGTDVPELEVDAGLFAAAKEVRDGEVVKRPVPEGKRFAVVWRRGSLAARSMDFRTEAPRIRQQLTNERLDAELRDLVAKLRQEHLREAHPELLVSHDFPLSDEPATAGAPTGTGHASSGTDRSNR